MISLFLFYIFRNLFHTTGDLTYQSPLVFKIKWECNESLHQLFTNFKEAYDSVMRKVFYNILILFGIPMKLVRLIILCLNETTESE